MTDSVVIDKIYASLLQSSSDVKYGFEQMRGSWGYKSMPKYQSNLVRIDKDIRQLAMDSPILYGEGHFWLFDGRIYVPINRKLIEEAFLRLVEHYEIIPMLRNKSKADYFVENISYYHVMVQSRNLIAFENGVLDIAPILRGKEPIFHEEFSPRFHVTYYHPYKYNRQAKCTKWLNFLHEVLPDKNSRVILQMFLGLGLIDSSEVYLPYEGKPAARVELCLMLIGPGGNGKGVIFRTAMGVYGKERFSEVPYEELTRPGDEGMRNRLQLRDKIFNWNSDEDGRVFGRKNTATFKKIVSGEPILERRIGGNVTENDKLPYLVFHLNELPYPDDQSLGFIRRLQYISFDVTIPRERRNPYLAQELVLNYPGIFNWVVRGAREVVRRKFIFPSSEGHKRQMLLSQLRGNAVIAWINAYGISYEPRVNGEECSWILSKDIIQSIEQFCDDNDAESPTKQMIGQTLARSGFSKKRSSEGPLYQMFGTNATKIMRPYVIRLEDMAVPYDEDSSSYIKEED